MVHHSVCLLLTCLAGIFASEGQQGAAVLKTPYGPTSAVISGVDTVTVGVPYEFQCRASCSPACRFTWTRGGLTSRGPKLSLLLKEREPPQVLTCSVENPTTRKSVSVQKTLQVTAGPSNIKISGPPMLTIGVESTFVCSADCFPSCSFTWSVLWEGEALATTRGNTTSLTPPKTANFETVICEAQDSVSHLFITKSLQLWVARLSGISITGPSTVTMGGKYTFTCYVTCTPSCDYTWTFNGKTFQGDQIQLPVFHKGEKPKVASQLVISIGDGSGSEPLTCKARNTASGATINSTKILTVIDPISVRPASQAPPLAAQPFSLQCVGSQNPASIAWLKNGLPLPASKRVSLSAHNTMLTFSPLLRSDGGLYQCVVSEGGSSIKSADYQMKVNFGPNNVEIIRADRGAVGKQLFVLPGSRTALRCSADCQPACSFTWLYRDRLLNTNASILFTPVTPPNQAVLMCVALNTVTMKINIIETIVVVPDPISVRPASQAPPLAAQPFSLQCVGSQNPASIAWLKNGLPLPASKRVSLSAHNTMLTFSPLLRSDGGLYQCVVSEGGSSIKSADYQMKVNFGPNNVEIVRADRGAVGQQLFVLPGSRTALRCSADCQPACSFTWLYRDRLLNTNASILFTPVTPPSQAVLMCVALNTVTMKINTFETTVVVPDGPEKAAISGPDSLKVGVGASFSCEAECVPSCSFSWSVNGGNRTGSGIDITLSHDVSIKSISCRAQNTVSGKAATVNKSLGVSGGM